MADIVVTVPKSFTYPDAPGLRGLAAWIAEGDAAGDAPTGQEWAFYCGGGRPNIIRGERVYVVCEGRLRGYSPLLRIESAWRGNGFALIRGSEAFAVTIPEPVQGFQGWRYRWWEREIEVPFPDWRTAK